MASSDRLIALVHDLSTELFDTIRELVFTADESTRRVTSTYRPASQLQVNKATRAIVATKFYRSGAYFDVDYKDFARWATSLPHAHFMMIVGFRVPSRYGQFHALFDKSTRPFPEEKRLLHEIVRFHLCGYATVTSCEGSHPGPVHVHFRDNSYNGQVTHWFVSNKDGILKYKKTNSGLRKD